MSRNSILLVDPNFSLSKHAHYHLLFKVTNDSFSYAVIDGQSDEVCVIFDKQNCSDLAQEIKQSFESDENLSIPYHSVKAAIHTKDFLFMPSEWLDRDNLNIYENYFSNSSEIYSKSEQKLGVELIYSIDPNLKASLPTNTRFYPQSSPLLVLNKQLDQEAVLIDFTAASFNFLYINDGKIHFQNHYQIENDEEFNYFILLIIGQLRLNNNVPIYLQGIINEGDGAYNCLLKYFNRLCFFLPSGQQNSELLNDMPKHYFSSLLALDLCE